MTNFISATFPSAERAGRPSLSREAALRSLGRNCPGVRRGRLADGGALREFASQKRSTSLVDPDYSLVGRQTRRENRPALRRRRAPRSRRLECAWGAFGGCRASAGMLTTGPALRRPYSLEAIGCRRPTHRRSAP